MILITGGAGYIGSQVNKELNKLGYKTIVVDNLINGHIELVKWGTFINLDLMEKKELIELFKAKKIDAVMHFAAFAYVGESVLEPKKYYLNNVVGTLNLLEAMLSAGVDKIIFSSTCAIYGNPVYTPMDEDHPKEPINPYGRSKLAVEHILEDFSRAYGLKYVSLRYFNVAGADFEGEVGEWHEPETHLIPNILDAAIGVKPYVEVFGTDYETEDGTCIRDYIHVVDLAKAHIDALEYLFEHESSDVFNLGTGKGCSVMEVIEAVKRITGKDFKVKLSDRRPGDPPILVAKAEKAKQILGWAPKHGLDEIIETAWRWHRRLRGLC
ncbi:MAG: UDP-glucose 4-epimerase GalE [Aquificae bacterium]|nr:UDP-glucose 4-epimerase GalE [Aquificota bacterium]